MLLKVEGGTHAGSFVVLVSRTDMSLDEQFTKHGTASAVVHLVRNPTESYLGNDKDLLTIAMAVVEPVVDG